MKEKKIPDQRLEERKKKKKENSRSKIGRKQKKYAERSLGQTTQSSPLPLIANQNPVR